MEKSLIDSLIEVLIIQYNRIKLYYPVNMCMQY